MSRCRRTSSYSHEEDLHLCGAYLCIFKNPIKCANHSKEQLWSQVEREYNNSKPDSITQYRPTRSLQSRMRVILAAVAKMAECIRRVQNLRLNGVSEQQVFFRAKMLLQEDKNFKKGFKFDHVWSLLNNSENVGDDTSSSKSASQGLSSFSLNINEESVETASNRELVGVKKAKVKRKYEDESTEVIEGIKEENRQLIELIKKRCEERKLARQIEMIRAQNQTKKLAMIELREENKILLKDLSSITDPNLLEFLRNEQRRIMTKRIRQPCQGVQRRSLSLG